MIIDSITIKKFRGFQDAGFKLGEKITVISGQNGTQKTTLLGVLSQPFSVTDKNNPIQASKPLCGGNYRSSFAEKFKLSNAFDHAKGHEWTLHLNRDEEPSFTVESIQRTSSSSNIRFWRKGSKAKGSGYIQVPVIYLSLSRLFPIGEDNQLDESDDITLSQPELDFYSEWHNKILLIPDVNMTSANYLSSKQKNTLGANTDFYDWKMNSSGQDNIGKILLAILSFRRLKEQFPEYYKGGILAIDELDATLYPASQIKLLEALRKFASSYDIQIVFTTHSLGMIEHACELQNDPRLEGQVNVVFLKKVNQTIQIQEKVSFEQVRSALKVSLDTIKGVDKISVFTEDNEGLLFLKSLLKGRMRVLKPINCTFGGSNLVELVSKKVPGFSLGESLVVLDGDVRKESSKLKKIQKHKNILILPGNLSPERLIASFLHALMDDSKIWDDIHKDYNKQFAFRDYTFQDIMSCRVKAKKWFNSQERYWGRSCARVISPWLQANKEIYEQFISEFEVWEKAHG